MRGGFGTASSFIYGNPTPHGGGMSSFITETPPRIGGRRQRAGAFAFTHPKPPVPEVRLP